MMKILIDCSLINFLKTPTGIPRVVTNYVVHGIQWGRERGYEVIPVVFYGNEMILPPNMPENLSKALITSAERFLRCIANAMHDVIERGRKILFHLLSAFGHLLFIDNQRLDRGVERILRGYLRIVQLVPYLLERQYRRIVTREGDILFCPAYWHDIDPKTYRAIKQRGCKIAILVHDILPVLYPQYYDYPWRYHFEQKLRASFSYTDKYFAVSRFTRDCVMQFATSNFLPRREIAVALNGLDNFGFSCLAADVLPTSTNLARFLERFPTFLLMVGSIEPKKGHIHIIEHLKTLWDEGYDLPLLIVGRAGWMSEAVIEAFRDTIVAEKWVFWYDDLNDIDLAIAFKRAQFLIFGSDVEGFGLPMIEALHFGCPVIANDTPISREILAKYGLFYQKQNEGLRDLLLAYAHEEAYGRVKASINDFRWPSWRECTEGLFNQLIDMNHPRNRFTEADQIAKTL